jgi:DNA-binding CsgD family transcriptional regulator
MGLSQKRLSRIAILYDRGMSYAEIARDLGIAKDKIAEAHRKLTAAFRHKSQDRLVRPAKRRRLSLSTGKSEPSRRSGVEQTEAGVLPRRSVSRELSVEPSEDRHLNEFDSYPILPKKEDDISGAKVDTDPGEGAASLWEYRTARIKLKQTKLELRLEEAKIQRLLLEDKLCRKRAKE